MTSFYKHKAIFNIDIVDSIKAESMTIFHSLL